MKRAIYNMKGKHAERGDQNIKKTQRRQYLTWKNALREEIRTSKQVTPRRKPYEIKNLACFKGKLIVIFVLIHL